MHHPIVLAVLTALVTGCAAPPPDPAPPPVLQPIATAPASGEAGSRLLVRPGVDLLAERLPAVLAGKRVGLITNQTGRDAAGRSTIDILAADRRLQLVALFAPEHGIRGVAAEGETIDDTRDVRTGLPVHSLYGATRKPTPAMLRGVEALVFDIQDVGARTYTYIYTMALAMQAAREQGIPFVVLDRPNPIGGVQVEGNILDTAYASFVGMYPIPLRHGMTVGELARLFNDAFGIGAELSVVAMTEWRRDIWWDETGLTFVPPSPNIRRLEAATLYRGTVLLEGTNLSEGRGTDFPFEQTGAPWLDPARVVAAMTALDLPGVAFAATTLSVDPSAAKFGGQTLPGVRLRVTDRTRFEPVRTGVLLIDTIRRLHPADFRFTGPTAAAPDAWWLDRLAGTDRLRLAIEAGTLRTLLDDWARDARRFREQRARYLLY